MINPDGFADQYHQRSDGKATFSSLNRILGESVFSSRPVAPLHGSLCKILAYDLVTLIRHLVSRGIDLTTFFRGPTTPSPAIGTPPEIAPMSNGDCEGFDRLVKESLSQGG